VRAVRERFPGVTVTLFDGTDDEVLQWIRERVVDLGVVTGSPVGLVTVPLGDDPFVAAVAPDDPLARQPTITARDLEREPVILSKGGCEPFIQRFFADAGVALTPAYEVRDMPTILAMVREGLGITLAPRLALPEPADGLRQLPLTPPLVRALALAVPVDTPVAPATQAFLDETVRWWQTVGAR
jgi:DNA-binding transcriptional LysR family regulator